jgi:hypothetical protein
MCNFAKADTYHQLQFSKPGDRWEVGTGFMLRRAGLRMTCKIAWPPTCWEIPRCRRLPGCHGDSRPWKTEVSRGKFDASRLNSNMPTWQRALTILVVNAFSFLQFDNDGRKLTSLDYTRLLVRAIWSFWKLVGWIYRQLSKLKISTCSHEMFTPRKTQQKKSTSHLQNYMHSTPGFRRYFLLPVSMLFMWSLFFFYLIHCLN